MHIRPYHPRDDHPRRRYRNKYGASESLEDKTLPPSRLRGFIADLAENWESYDIGSEEGVSSGKIKYMTDDQIALWMIELLNRNLVRMHSYLFAEEPEL